MRPDLTKLALNVSEGYLVGLSRRYGGVRGSLNGLNAYGPFEWFSHLYVATTHDAPAPDVNRAKITFQAPPGEAQWPWLWAEHFSKDDRVAIIAAQTVPDARRHTPFVGFIVDVDYQFDTGSAMTVTAMSNAWRLKRDMIVYGRYMGDYDGYSMLYEGLPCIFNAGGKPNRYRRGFRFFTYDGNGEYWSAWDILQYLWHRYNRRNAWVTSRDDKDRDEEIVDPVTKEVLKRRVGEVNVEGKDLWTALGILGDRCSCDFFEAIRADKHGMPRSQVKVVARGAGRRRTVKHQSPVNIADPASPLLPVVDLEQTNIFSGSLAHSNASVITVPIVLGGRDIYEISVELYPAWDTSTEPGEDMADGKDICLPDEESDRTDPYPSRYVLGGGDAAPYFDTFRMWDANTDGKFSDGPYGSPPVPDMAVLAGLVGYDREWYMQKIAMDEGRDEPYAVDELKWPKMPYKPLATLSASGENSGNRRLSAFVEIQWAPPNGPWVGLPGCRILPDRLGVWLATPNLAAVVPPLTQPSHTNNLFWRCWGGTRPKLRLTCSVISPYRSVAATKPTADAGSAFETTAVFDRGNLGGSYIRGPSSVLGLHKLIEPVGSEASRDELKRTADMITAAVRYGSIEANLPIEWPDEDIALGDIITDIEGIEVPLTVGRGRDAPAPRVVGIMRDFTPQGYSMSITLDTDRKAGLV